MFHIIIIYESSQNGLDLNPQVLGICSMVFGLSLCFLLLLIFVLVVGDLDDQAMVRCG